MSLCRFNNAPDFKAENENTASGSAYNITLTAEISKDDIEDESEVTCLVKIPNTEYETKDTVTYDGMKNFQLINS